MFKKVLLATDFSQCAEQLWNCVDELKELGMEEVLAAHIAPLMSGGRSQDQAREALDAKKAELVSRGINSRSIVRVGLPAHEINDLAVKEQADLILVGAKGENRIREIFLGSTVWDLIRTGRTPILIEKFIMEDNKCVAVCTKKFRRVLLPIDFSEDSFRVYSLFINKLAGRVEEAVLVHVVDKGHTEEVVEKQKDEALDRLTALRQNLEDAGIKTEIRVRIGMPARQIAKIAEEDNVSLVMMATRGAGNIRELFVGSTAENVIRDSSRPVLLFPVISRK